MDIHINLYPATTVAITPVHGLRLVTADQLVDVHVNEHHQSQGCEKRNGKPRPEFCFCQEPENIMLTLKQMVLNIFFQKGIIL